MALFQLQRLRSRSPERRQLLEIFTHVLYGLDSSDEALVFKCSERIYAEAPELVLRCFVDERGLIGHLNIYHVTSHLLALGYSVQMVDTTDHFADAKLTAIVHNVSYNYNHSAFFCLFCIHAVRSGAFALRSGLPYVMMMGGTDINVNVHDPRKLDTVRSVLAHARRIIAFTEDMRARAVALLQGEPIPPITVISQVGVVSGREGQSTDFPHTLSHEIRETLRLTPQHRLLLLPSGLRPVASVAHSHR